MTKYYPCLAAAITLFALFPAAEARVREQSSVNWRTFEVPALGTRVQYPADIFTPAGDPEMRVGQRLSALTDVCRFTLVPTKPARPPELI